MALQRGCLQVDGETQTIGFARERSHARRLADMRIRSQMAFARIAFMIIRINLEEYERVRICASVRSRRIGHGLHRSNRQLLWASCRWPFPRIPCDLLRVSLLSKGMSASASRKWVWAGHGAGRKRPPRRQRELRWEASASSRSAVSSGSCCLRRGPSGLSPLQLLHGC